jgi:hypothetical protein
VDLKDLWEESIKGAFQRNYRKTGCCGRLFYTYSNPFIESINANNSEMKLTMTEDLNEIDDETTLIVAKFTMNLNHRI